MGQLIAFVAHPAAAFFEDTFFQSDIDERTDIADAFVIHDVEFRLGEGRGDFVLHHFDPRAVAGHDAVRLLDRADTADVHAHAGVKFERLAAGGGLRVAEHHADFFADLVGEDAGRAGFGDQRGQFAHGRTHQAGLRADRGIADLAFQFLLGHQRGDGIEHNDVEGVGTDQRFANAQGLFARAGLGDEKVVEVDPQTLRILRIEGVLDVDEGGQPAAFLRLGDDGQGEGRFAG